jgi:hypothetical protein
MKRAIFDIDGCLADDEWRKQYIDMGTIDLEKRYDQYHSQSKKDISFNQEIVHSYVKAGNRIAFVTTRPEKFRNQTWEWLTGNYQLPEDTLLIMRPTSNHAPSAILKPKLIMHNFTREEIEVVFDNRDDVLDAYRRANIPNCKRLTTNGVIADVQTVPEIMRSMAQTFEERNKVYGASYLKYGNVMTALYPDGLTLKAIDDFNRFGVLSMIVSKLTRYTANETGHKDSAHDMAVYAAMLEELTR